MRRLFIIIIYILATHPLSAQRISREYRDVPLSEALRQISQEQKRWSINFLYDELEDFRITTQVKNASVPDALRQMIGFYPLRMIVRERDIYVECPIKTGRRYVGELRDEEDQPVAFANLCLLSPQDSTVLARGVSSEGGTFVIPCDSQNVLLRATFIGYEPLYYLSQSEDLGILRMRSSQIVLNGLQVNGERQIVKAENGHLTYNMPQLLEILPADDAYEALTRIPGIIDSDGSLSFAGQSVTLIINGKPTTLSAEQVIERLKQMPASMLAKAEVMASAPAKYHVHGMAINVITKDYSGTNQFAGQLQGFYRQNKYGYGQGKGNMIYQHGNFGLDASYSCGYGTAYGQVEHEAHHPLGYQRVDYSDKTERKNQTLNHNYRIGLDYAFSKESRLNAAYTGKWASNDATNTSTGLETSVQKSEVHTYLHNVDASYTSPFGLQLSASYTNYQNPRTQHLDGHLYDTERNLSVDSRQRISKWLFAADQTHDIGKGWELNYGVEAQLTNNTSYQTTRDANGRPLADATSHVDYDERILDIYAGFNKQITPSFSVETSLGAEQYHTPKWNEWRWYPTLNTLWTVDKDNMLNLSFSSQNVFPTYWSTMSSIFYTSAYSEIWGNPDLKPNSQYNIDLIWQLRQRYTFTAYAKFIPDYSVQLAYQPSDRMAVIMKEHNFNYMNVCGLQASARFSAGKWLNGTVMATGNYRHDKSDRFFDLPFDRKQLTLILSSTTAIQFSPRHDIRLILNPFFQSKAIQGVYDIDPAFRLNASLRWTSGNKKWSVIAAGQNITNSRVITHSGLANQDYTMRVWLEYPNASLTAIYRIGGFKEKKTKAVDTSRMGY